MILIYNLCLPTGRLSSSSETGKMLAKALSCDHTDSHARVYLKIPEQTKSYSQLMQQIRKSYNSIVTGQIEKIINKGIP